MTFTESLNLFYLWLALFAVTSLIEIPVAPDDSQAEDYPNSIWAFVLFVLRFFILYPVLVLLWGHLLIYAFGFALIILIVISFRLDKQLWQRKEVRHLRIFASRQIQHLRNFISKYMSRVIKVLRWLMYGCTLILMVFSLWIFGLEGTIYTLIFSSICLIPLFFLVTFFASFKSRNIKKDLVAFFLMLGIGITVYRQVLLVFDPINWDDWSSSRFLFPPEALCRVLNGFGEQRLEISPVQVSFQRERLRDIFLTGKFEYYPIRKGLLTISSDSRHLVWSSIEDPLRPSTSGVVFTYTNRDTQAAFDCSTQLLGYDVQQNIEPIFIDYANSRIYTTTSTKLGRLESTGWYTDFDQKIWDGDLLLDAWLYVMIQNRRSEVRCGRDERVGSYADIYPVVYEFLTSQAVINPLLGANFDLYSIRLDCLGENLIIVTSRGTFLFEIDKANSRAY